MKAIKLFLVDDSISIITYLEKVFKEVSDIEIIGKARSGVEAVRQIPELKPDCVILDLEMPEMDGLQVIQHLVRVFPVPILVFSSYTYEGNKITTKALMEGALDFLKKPQKTNDLELVKDELITKVRMVSKVKVLKKIDIGRYKTVEKKSSVLKQGVDRNINRIIVIGVSTGGPTTLSALISRLPPSLFAPIVIAQHMQKNFTRFLAEQLQEFTHYKVKEAEDNEQIYSGTIYIGQGGMDLFINEDSTFQIKEPVTFASPCVDFLFESAAKVFNDKLIGVILTGMGKDGLEGVKAIKEAGGRVIAESDESAIVYGMPRVVIENNLADRTSHVRYIADIIEEYMEPSYNNDSI